MLNLSSFLSLSLLFPEMGRLGLMWLCGGKGKASQSPWILSEWSGPIPSAVSWIHMGLWGIWLTHTLILTLCLWFASHTAAFLCVLRPLPVLWSSKHQHIHSLRHTWPSRTPRGQSSASFIWPLAKATTTLLPHVLTKSLPIWPFPPRVSVLIGEKLSSSLNLLIRMHDLKIYFSNSLSFILRSTSTEG